MTSVSVNCLHCSSDINFTRQDADNSLLVCPKCLLSFCYCVQCDSFMTEVVDKVYYHCDSCHNSINIVVKVCGDPKCYVKVEDPMADMRTCGCGRVFCCQHWKDTVVCAGCPITDGYQPLCRLCAVAKNDYFLCPKCSMSQ